MRKILTLCLLCSCLFIGYAQQSKLKTDKEILEQASLTQKGLNEKIRLDISGLSLYDFISSIAEEHQLNISADSSLNDLVTSNFYDIEVKNILLFLIDNYNLDMKMTNGILSFKKKKKPEPKPKPKPVKEIDVNYNSQNNFLSVKLKNDSLPLVAKKITEVTNKNVVLAPDVKTMKVSSYIINRSFDQVLEMMAKSNDLSVTKDENDFYYLEKNNTESKNETTNNAKGRNNKPQRPAATGQLSMALNPNGYLNIKAYEADLTSIISEAAELLNIDYVLYDKPKDEVSTLLAAEIGFEELLHHIFKGKKYTYKKAGTLYYIGEQNTEGLRISELIQLENRTVELVLGTLPAELLEDVEVKEVLELNGVVASGSRRKIEELKTFIRQIDQVVPLVQIEVLIVQYEKSYDIQTGLRAILGEEGRDIKTEGTLLSGVDVSINANTINTLIDGFNGFGVFNLGKVTKEFYASLTALENNSIVNLQSTPKIATLNGHDATISIGETSYYFEQRNELVTSGVNNNILQSGQWRPTEANLSVSIKPFVSKDEQVTLTINVEKNAFLGRAGENAPPDKATQTFESLVRVKNNEMILLGGLDELERQNSGTGTPLLSRIPVIKWFFSSKRKAKSKSKLHVFIKPTIVY